MYIIVYNTNYFGCDFGCVILGVWKVLPFGVLLLKGQNGQTWKDHMCNYAP